MMKRISVVLLYFLVVRLFSISFASETAAGASYRDYVYIDTSDDENAARMPPLAGAKLQSIAHHLLSYTPKGLSEELRSLNPGEIQKTLKFAHNWNLLHVAVDSDNTEAAEVLIKNFGFNPNAWSPRFGTCAYLVKSVEMVKLLQHYGCDFNIARPCELYTSALNSAIKRKNLSIFASQSELANVERNSLFIEGLRDSQARNSPQVFKGARIEIFFKLLAKMPNCEHANKPNALLQLSYSGEEGKDAGGLTYDFINFAIEELVTDGETFQFNRERGIYDFKPTAGSARVRLAGYLVGLSIFHNNPLGIIFTPIIYELILAKDVDRDINFVALAEESNVDIEASFTKIREMREDAMNSLEYPSDIKSGKRRRFNFVLDRRSIPDYLSTISRELVYESKKEIYEQFLIGLNRAIDAPIISEFLCTENLKQIIFGQAKDFTGKDLMDNLEHFIGFGDRSGDIYKWFSEIIDEMGPGFRAEFLNFSMAMKRLPLGGFAALSWKFKIEALPVAALSNPDTYLPKVATCSNTIFLPLYSRKDIMLEKLLYAMEHSTGFDIE